VSDHYATLGVAETATSDEIRRAYLKLARDRHPDRFTDPAEKERSQAFFKELTEAFNTLTNDRARRDYDAARAKPKLETPEEIAQDAYQRALKRAEERDVAGAVELLKVAVHHVPGEAQYHAALARALSRQPHTMREAIGVFEKLLQLQPRNAAYHSELANLLVAQGLRLRARKVVEAGLSVAPRDEQLRRLAGEVGAAEAPAVPEGRSNTGRLSGLKDIFGRKG
jgi:curved DNA-binding protein CbpA